ncbi:MAG: alanine racemase [Thermodesulfobacteriota bacterium]
MGDMQAGIFQDAIQVTIDLHWIQSNYLQLAARGKRIIPVIKADAYGHGLLPVAETLVKAGAGELAVGSVGEAVLLRETFDGRIVSLLGPLENPDFSAVIEYGILPLVYNFDQLRRLNECARNDGKVVFVALKFDTGMNRLGFSGQEVPAVVSTLNDLNYIEAILLCSHLATAEEPGSKDFTLEQAANLCRIGGELKQAGLKLQYSLANSAATLAFPELHFDAQRPGIALYGANPFAENSWKDKGTGLIPSMEVTAPVIDVHRLKKGEFISYGRKFHAPRDMRVAIVASGYADLYSRGLSNKGEMLLHGSRAPVIGQVCMQLTAIDISHIPQAGAGDRAYLLGGSEPNSIKPEELARWWGTIPNEVFCAFGRNKRKYVDGDISIKSRTRYYQCRGLGRLPFRKLCLAKSSMT